MTLAQERQIVAHTPLLSLYVEEVKPGDCLVPEPEHLRDIGAYMEADAYQKRAAEAVQHTGNVGAGN